MHIELNARIAPIGPTRWRGTQRIGSLRVSLHQCGAFVASVLALLAPPVGATVADDMRTVAGLDTEYQAAVKNNDATTMGRILADDFVLVTSRGKVYSKGDLLKDARARTTTYEHQEDSNQTVRVWGDTAVVTALLWAKGTDETGKPFDYQVWFSDTYVRGAKGWSYVLGQAAGALPKVPAVAALPLLPGCFEAA